MKIVLTTINAKWIHPSLALRLLKANLGELEDNCEILEFALRQPFKEKFETIIASQASIFGISVSIWNHSATLELLKALETRWNFAQSIPPTQAHRQAPEPLPKPIIVLGGPEVSALDKSAEIFCYADYVIRGEGEENFRSLCNDIFSGKRQAGENNSGAIFIGQDSTVIDVNQITSPYNLYTDEDLGRKLVYVEASRGCPFGCEFCQSSIEKQISVREFFLAPFLADMGRLIDRGGRSFKFLDRTFNLNIKRAIEICEYFLKKINALEAENKTATEPENDLAPESTSIHRQNRRLCVHFEMVPFLFPLELKKILCLFPPGSLRLELGIQTFNAATAKLISLAGEPAREPIGEPAVESRQSANRQELALENLKFLRRETNAIIHVDLIAGLPEEDLVSFGAGFDRLWQVLSEEKAAEHCSSSLTSESHFEIQLGILKCLPGTPIARHNETCCMRYSPNPPYEVIETGAMPKTELDRIKNFARFWELLYNRNPFPEILSDLFPPGKPVFDNFMLLSDELLKKIGRNWGIDRQELKNHLEIFLQTKSFGAEGQKM